MTTINPKDRRHEVREGAKDEAQANISEARRTDKTAESRTDERVNGRADDTDRPSEDRAANDRAANDRTGNDRTAENRTAEDRATQQDRETQDRTDNRMPADQAPVAARTRVFEENDAQQYRTQWRELQATFVDEPRAAVREADTLVTQMMETLTSHLNEQKRSLQGEWDSVDTEQLRVALQRYRSLFDQMLQV